MGLKTSVQLTVRLPYYISSLVGASAGANSSDGAIFAAFFVIGVVQLEVDSFTTTFTLSAGLWCASAVALVLSVETMFHMVLLAPRLLNLCHFSNKLLFASADFSATGSLWVN